MRRPLTWTLLTLSLGWIGGWTAPASAEEHPAPAARPLVVAVPTDVLTFDPADYPQHWVTRAVLGNIYGALVDRGPDGELRPALAAGWEAISPTRWRFRLKRGIRFHDGAPLTARDVVASVRRALPGGLGSFTAPLAEQLEPIAEVRDLDGMGVEFVLKRPWPQLLSALTGVGILPAGAAAQVTERAPGTGLFQLDSWARGNRVVLARAPNVGWSMAAGGEQAAGAVGQVVFEVMPNAEERLAALASGRVDIATDLPPTVWPRLAALPRAASARVPGNSVFFVSFNLRQPPFNDQRVRQAIAHGLDVDGALRELNSGVGRRAAVPLPPAAFGASSDLAPFAHDASRARAMLAEAGYPNGFSFELDTVPERRKFAENYARSLAEIGLAVTVRTWPDWRTMKQALQGGGRAAWLDDWTFYFFDASEILEAKFATGGRANYGGYANPAFDRLLAESERATDLAVRRRLLQQAQALLYADLPAVAEFVAEDVYGLQESVGGFRPFADRSLPLGGLANVLPVAPPRR